MGISKKRAEQERRYDAEAEHAAADAVELVKSMASAKFDESVDMVFQLGIDARQADQIVRSTVSLPHGTGKDIRILVFANDQAAEAEEAGADLVGGKELADRIASGDQALDWDVTIASPDMMPIVGKLGQVLGPRGLMPNPKTGTVTKDVGKTVAEFKAGRVEYRNDRYGNVHVPIGRVSFDADKLLENLLVVSDEVIRSKPASSKGKFIRNASISSTMGPGVALDMASVEAELKARA